MLYGEQSPEVKKLAEESEARLRKLIGDEEYERIQGIASLRSPSIALYDGEPRPFLEYWDARGFGLLAGFSTSARSAVLEFLGASMAICFGQARFESVFKPVDPQTLSRG